VKYDTLESSDSIVVATTGPAWCRSLVQGLGHASLALFFQPQIPLARLGSDFPCIQLLRANALCFGLAGYAPFRLHMKTVILSILTND